LISKPTGGAGEGYSCWGREGSGQNGRGRHVERGKEREKKAGLTGSKKKSQQKRGAAKEKSQAILVTGERGGLRGKIQSDRMAFGTRSEGPGSHVVGKEEGDLEEGERKVRIVQGKEKKGGGGGLAKRQRLT